LTTDLGKAVGISPGKCYGNQLILEAAKVTVTYNCNELLKSESVFSLIPESCWSWNKCFFQKC